ncbi:oxidoreductase C-terminal domain-containing protein [Salinicoccus albus]|uniref:oxidoreductase C-terminal domain-containing protein n=1 Tax=Salinicoccus albus TaxID=418756 RepID=UPI000380B442|nr:oxidoreductase C-terminal domain-containing protein [Salinicoccus albus]
MKNIIYPQLSPYTYTPYFWSDQYENRFQYFGHAKTWTQIIQRGSMESNAFTYFYLDNQNIIQAAFISNQAKNALPVRKMIKQQIPIAPKDLADESIPLKKLQRSLA